MADIALEPIDTAQRVDHASLSERLAALRRRTGFVVTDRTLLTVGSILMPLGVVLVMLGWYGSAHTTRSWEQLSYIASGGLGGVALVIAGGFCYFGFFLARLLATSREVLDSLLRLEERFETVGLSAQSPVDRNARLPLVSLVATRRGTMYHRPECATVAGRPPAELRTVRATDGLSPCKICIPTPT
jgi:hypothetical protein